MLVTASGSEEKSVDKRTEAAVRSDARGVVLGRASAARVAAERLPPNRRRRLAKDRSARGRHMISRMIDGLAEQPVAHPRLVSDVWQAVLDRAWIDGGKIPPCWLNGRTDRDLHVFTNGILNIRTSILEPHDPAFFNLTACDFPYVPGSTCPKMDKWIAWFASDNPKLVDLLWEIYAWVMCPSLRLQKYIVMVGGEHGKQCYLKVLTKLVGGNIAAIPLEQFGVRFTSSALLGKACNIVGDLNELDRISEGHLKMYVDNSEVWCEEKFKPGSTAVLDTRFIFSTNKMIPLSERRMAIGGVRW